jgi:hypothetical protein
VVLEALGFAEHGCGHRAANIHGEPTPLSRAVALRDAGALDAAAADPASRLNAQQRHTMRCVLGTGVRGQGAQACE